MGCKICGRDLEKDDKDVCPACDNNNDVQRKKGMEIAAAIFGVICCVAYGVKTFFSGSSNDS